MWNCPDCDATRPARFSRLILIYIYIFFFFNFTFLISLRLAVSFATTSLWLVEIVKIRILTSNLRQQRTESCEKVAECNYHWGMVDRTYLQQKEKMVRNMFLCFFFFFFFFRRNDFTTTFTIFWKIRNTFLWEMRILFNSEFWEYNRLKFPLILIEQHCYK